MTEQVRQSTGTTDPRLLLEASQQEAPVGPATNEALEIAEGRQDANPSGAGTTGKSAGGGGNNRLLRNATRAVVGIGLALLIGLSTVGCATSQAQTAPGPGTASVQTVDADQCRRDTAYAAAIGAELGRNAAGQQGGVIGGALAALLQKTVGCTSAAEVEQPQAIKDLNKEIAEALVQDGARFTTDASLPDAMKRILDYVADELKSRPNAKVLLVAHADVAGNVAFTNRGLSGDRAEAAETYLRDAGIQNQIHTESAGEAEGKNILEVVILEQTQRQTQQDRPGVFRIGNFTFQIGGGSGRHQGHQGSGQVVMPGDNPDATVSRPNVNFPGPANQGQHDRTPRVPGSTGWGGN